MKITAREALCGSFVVIIVNRNIEWEKGLVGVCSEYPGRNSKRAGRESELRCVHGTILVEIVFPFAANDLQPPYVYLHRCRMWCFQPSIWFCDVHGVAALVGRGGRDFRSGYPMGAKETSAMEVGFD
ncbi:hypothetical protein TNCV_2503831 [Trichonephila clavipes]|nr:hypothetical protein TNCV_2503831 [Trichonephila clavipes]